ncbi:hypothetical protein [Erythrobacter donghaensis]|uniref:hypothetical protein n=1 Tax=Erythrobacter donghaensis TaxID=267135 RepID=UPI000A3A6FEA|nr:hypothetical protein [Erythrobacter donghaensis]
MKEALIAFARAVGWGTLAGGLPWTLLLFVPMAWDMIDYASIGEIVVLAVTPLTLSGVMVLVSAVMFGLPLTTFLSVQKRETWSAYACAGLVLGAIVPVVLIALTDGPDDLEILFFVLPGAFAGLVTGTSWGRWREAQRVARSDGL